MALWLIAFVHLKHVLETGKYGLLYLVVLASPCSVIDLFMREKSIEFQWIYHAGEFSEAQSKYRLGVL